jgi:uncharacterized protein YegJ (DUF2314 family)
VTAAQLTTFTAIFWKQFTMPIKQPINDSEALAVTVPRNDPDMEDAYQEARRTIARFIQLLKEPTPTQSYSALKIRISGQDQDEYIWISGTTYDGLMFTGIVSGSDLPLPLKPGDKCRIRADGIYDWMIVDNGKLVGGYTIRVMRSKMTIENRERFDASLWFAVE